MSNWSPSLLMTLPLTVKDTDTYFFRNGLICRVKCEERKADNQCWVKERHSVHCCHLSTDSFNLHHSGRVSQITFQKSFAVMFINEKHLRLYCCSKGCHVISFWPVIQQKKKIIQLFQIICSNSGFNLNCMKFICFATFLLYAMWNHLRIQLNRSLWGITVSF